MDPSLSTKDTEQKLRELDEGCTPISVLLALMMQQLLRDNEAIKQACRENRNLLGELTIKVNEQQTQIREQQNYICDLENRLNCADAYSGRSTVIISNVPEEKEEKPAELAHKVSQLTGVSIADIGHVHRNRVRRAGKPRTITLQLTRACDKDRIMASRKRLKGSRGVGIFHHMTPGLIETKNNLEKVEGVNWVAFSGHGKMFSVNWGNDQFISRILSLSDFLDKRDKQRAS